MRSVIVSLLLTLRVTLRDRAALQLEILALRHQLHVINRSRPQRLRLTHADRMLWVWLSKRWHGWRAALVIVRPETVLAWHRRGFRLFWTWKSRHRVGRPGVPPDVRQLIRTMADMNPLWGAPRIHGELLKLGIVGESGHRCEVHAPAPTTALTDVADVSHESCRPDHGRRFLRRADRHVSTPLRAGHFGASASPRRTRGRHRPSHGGVDRPTTPRGVSWGRGPSVSHSRS